VHARGATAYSKETRFAPVDGLAEDSSTQLYIPLSSLYQEARAERQISFPDVLSLDRAASADRMKPLGAESGGANLGTF
jgi:phage terminase large subunit-like protein